MSVYGPNYPATAANDTSRAGTNIDWLNPNNIFADDGVFADIVNDGVTNASEYIKGTNYGFTVPSGSTINGIEVTIKRRRTNPSGGPVVNDALLYLIKGGTIQTGWTNKASGTNWPIINAAVTYGGPADMWGGTLSASDVNASNFGVALAIDLLDGSTTVQASLDSMTITVYYTPPTSVGTGAALLMMMVK